MAVFIGFHRSPTVTTQEKAWTQMGVKVFQEVNLAAKAARKSYNEFFLHLKTMQNLVKWMDGNDSSLEFVALCEDLGVNPEEIRENVLQSGPPKLMEFLTEPHATCPLCHRAK
jgi:hypothetical protein